MTDAPEPPGMPRPVLELALDPQDVPKLLKLPALRGATRKRAQKHALIWHDTTDGALAAQGLACVERREGLSAAIWRLERLVPDATTIWPPGARPPVLGEAQKADALDRAIRPDTAQPVAAFDGQHQTLTTTSGVEMQLIQGSLRAVTATHKICRLRLTGAAAPALALAIAAELTARVPARSLAAEALALAHRAVPAPPLGTPALRADMDVGGGFAFVVAYLAGVILHHAPGAALGRDVEAVHQMRVALRRLRSAVLLFRRAAACPELDAAAQGLRLLGQALGPARDWDVFCTGTGRSVGAAFPDDKPVAQLLKAAERRRLAAYANLRTYLDSPEFRELGIRLAILASTRPWHQTTAEDPDRRAARLAEPLPRYAARALGKRLETVLEPGADLSALPIEALHDIRLHAKRLRYAAEFFAPLFSGRDTRRFLRRLAELQEQLGLLNDGAVAAALMAELPGAGPARHRAWGIVCGFVAAHATGSRKTIAQSWKRFRKQEPFWD